MTYTLGSMCGGLCRLGVRIYPPSETPTSAPKVIGSTEGIVTPSHNISHEAALRDLVVTQLELHATSIDLPYFKSPALQLRELASSVERIRYRHDLATLVKEIFAFAATSKERASLVANTLPHLISLCSTASKAYLLDLALREPRKTLRKRLAYGVLRSASNREQLFSLLTPIRSRNLAECGSRKVTELVAKALALRALEHLEIPGPMWGRSFKANNPKNRQTARERVRQLESAARDGLKALEKLKFLSHKPRRGGISKELIPARPLRDARTTLAFVANGAEKLRSGPRPTYGRLREFVNTASRRIGCERSDGIRLLQSHTLPDKDLWNPSLVKRFNSALSLIPEGERLMTPQLREFTLSKLNSNTAERRQSGRIAFDYPGELFKWRDTRYEGKQALIRLVLHEVAHSIQMGHEGRVNVWQPNTGEIFSPNNPLIDFKGFQDISGWRVVDWFEPSAYVGQHAIRIDGKLFPLGRPVSISLPLNPPEGTERREERVILTRGAGNILFCHRIDAAFSLNNYALSEPSEDWAEAFTEYLLCPDRLIELAPEKFHYMEIHFRHYRANRDFTRISAALRALRPAPEKPASKPTPDHAPPPLAEQKQFEFDFVK